MSEENSTDRKSQLEQLKSKIAKQKAAIRLDEYQMQKLQLLEQLDALDKAIESIESELN